MSKTAKNLSKSLPATQQKPALVTDALLSRAEKEIDSVIGQLSGLQCFLKALCETQSSVVSLEDLTFGFSFLLDATEGSAERTKMLLAGARMKN